MSRAPWAFEEAGSIFHWISTFASECGEARMISPEFSYCVMVTHFQDFYIAILTLKDDIVRAEAIFWFSLDSTTPSPGSRAI